MSGCLIVVVGVLAVIGSVYVLCRSDEFVIKMINLFRDVHRLEKRSNEFWDRLHRVEKEIRNLKENAGK